MVWRSLSADSHVSLKSPLGARLKATHDGGRSQPGERHDPTAEVLMIISAAEKTRYGGFLENIPVPTIF
jgi:hypothetical protein